MGWLEQRWYQKQPAPLWLRPLGRLYQHLAAKRKHAFLSGKKAVYRAPVPVIVVGNISVGGTGKTPVTLWLIERLRAAGYTPGVVSRGYGAKAPQYPFVVTADTDPAEGGDEPCMLVKRAGCPLVIDPDRPAAVRHLLKQFDCDLIISDDGLQHYALARDVELAVVDAQRGLGNGCCLPAGPLREPAERLNSVDFIIRNGEGAEFSDAVPMTLQPTRFVSLDGRTRMPIEQWPHKQAHAVAGIGNPGRFFDTLRNVVGMEPLEHPFADHHAYSAEDFSFADELPVVMTEKDAVKAVKLNNIEGWYLEVSATLPSSFEAALLNKLDSISHTVESNG